MLNAAGSATPQALGTATAGTSVAYSRQDHVHAMPTAAQVGAISTDQASGFATLTAGTLTTSQVAALTGDVTSNAGSPATTVVKLQGNSVSNAAPTNGQVLQWNGTAWVPGALANGGSGGGGVTFYLNAGTAGQTPITGLPSATKELGRVAEVAQTTITSGSLSQVSYDLIAGFVSDVLDPDTTAIPAGLFDFNLWASSNANSSNQTIIQFLVYKYNGSSAPTLIATSDDVSIYDPSVTAQYILSVTIPQTTILATDRLYVEVRGKATANNRTITLKFGDSTPSHMHSTIPSVSGSGLVKVVNSVMQSPASLLVDADVASNAAIAVSKISGAVTTTDLTAYVATSQLGALSGVAQLDGAGKLRTVQIPSLTTSQIAQITPAGIGAVATSQLTTAATANGVPQLDASGFLATAQLATIAGLPSGAQGSSTVVPIVTVDAKGRVTNLTTTSISGGVTTFSGGLTGLTPASATSGAVTLGGTLAVANGGTGANNVGDAILNLGIAMRVIEVHLPISVAGTMNTGVTPNTFTVSATGVFTADGYTPVLGDIISFIGNTGIQSGFWKVTTLGATGVQAVFERPSWFSGTVKNSMAIARFGASQAGYVYSYSGGLGNVDISVGTTVIQKTLIGTRTNNATLGSNVFLAKQTFVGGTTTVAPFQFQAGIVTTTPQAHAVEWDGTFQYNVTSGSVRTQQAAFVPVPATATSTGVAGQIAYDSTGFYVCVATNTWRKASLATF